MNDFSEDVLIALHSWDPEGKTTKGPYSEWENSIKESTLRRDSILSLWMHRKDDNTEVNSDDLKWDL